MSNNLDRSQDTSRENQSADQLLEEALRGQFEGEGPDRLRSLLDGKKQENLAGTRIEADREAGRPEAKGAVALVEGAHAEANVANAEAVDATEKDLADLEAKIIQVMDAIDDTREKVGALLGSAKELSQTAMDAARKFPPAIWKKLDAQFGISAKLEKMKKSMGIGLSEQDKAEKASRDAEARIQSFVDTHGSIVDNAVIEHGNHEKVLEATHAKLDDANKQKEELQANIDFVRTDNWLATRPKERDQQLATMEKTLKKLEGQISTLQSLEQDYEAKLKDGDPRALLDAKEKERDAISMQVEDMLQQMADLRNNHLAQGKEKDLARMEKKLNALRDKRDGLEGEVRAYEDRIAKDKAENEGEAISYETQQVEPDVAQSPKDSTEKAKEQSYESVVGESDKVMKSMSDTLRDLEQTVRTLEAWGTTQYSPDAMLRISRDFSRKFGGQIQRLGRILETNSSLTSDEKMDLQSRIDEMNKTHLAIGLEMQELKGHLSEPKVEAQPKLSVDDLEQMVSGQVGTENEQPAPEAAVGEAVSKQAEAPVQTAELPTEIASLMQQIETIDAQIAKERKENEQIKFKVADDGVKEKFNANNDRITAERIKKLEQEKNNSLDQVREQSATLLESTEKDFGAQITDVHNVNVGIEGMIRAGLHAVSDEKIREVIGRGETGAQAIAKLEARISSVEQIPDVDVAALKQSLQELRDEHALLMIHIARFGQELRSRDDLPGDDTSAEQAKTEKTQESKTSGKGSAEKKEQVEASGLEELEAMAAGKTSTPEKRKAEAVEEGYENILFNSLDHLQVSDKMTSIQAISRLIVGEKRNAALEHEVGIKLTLVNSGRLAEMMKLMDGADSGRQKKLILRTFLMDAKLQKEIMALHTESLNKVEGHSDQLAA